jgi:hypothetical protein
MDSLDSLLKDVEGISSSAFSRPKTLADMRSTSKSASGSSGRLGINASPGSTPRSAASRPTTRTAGKTPLPAAAPEAADVAPFDSFELLIPKPTVKCELTEAYMACRYGAWPLGCRFLIADLAASCHYCRSNPIHRRATSSGTVPGWRGDLPACCQSTPLNTRKLLQRSTCFCSLCAPNAGDDASYFRFWCTQVPIFCQAQLQSIHSQALGKGAPRLPHPWMRTLLHFLVG